MRRDTVLMFAFVLATAQSMANEGAERVSGDDVAVLEGVMHDQCMTDNRIVIVSDAPETRVSQPAHPDPLLEQEFGTRLEARAAEKSRWPPALLCKNVPVIPAARIQDYFERTRRVPDDWAGLLEEFGADGCMTVSRPAFSADRTRAVVTTRYRYGELFKTDRVIELTRTVNGWRILRAFNAWIE